ncbi:MAG: dTMP kinase [Holosporaceae bacterium]|jgi:dTMP kinase|nr:dTMP kinase [Holosporaceae bacterium]
MRGKFVTFEGGDGVGKSTQASLLERALRDLGEKVYLTREPGGNELCEQIRELLKVSPKMDRTCCLLLLFAARREHFVKTISPLLERGYFVICDRFYDSSLVYQGVLEGIPIENILELKRMTLGDFEPDLTLVLDMKAELSVYRLRGRHLIQDEYDAMNVEEHGRLREGFRKIADTFSFRAVLIDAEGTKEAVHSRIFAAVEKKFSLGATGSKLCAGGCR